MTKIRLFALLGFILFIGSVSFAQTKADYLKSLEADLGEWHLLPESVKSDIEGLPEKMPPMKMVCTREGDTFHREWWVKTPEGEWVSQAKQKEWYDPKEKKIVYEATDQQLGETHGEMTMTGEGTYSYVEYNTDKKMVGKGTITTRADQAVVKGSWFTDMEGKVQAEPTGNIEMTWKKM